jgi:hypothetical protein
METARDLPRRLHFMFILAVVLAGLTFHSG